MRVANLDAGLKRGEDTWDDFIRRCAATLWACDFFSKPVWTLRGLVEVYILFFINVGTRQVYVAGLTAQPNRAWVAQQARNAALHFAGQDEKPAVLLRDNDQKFGPEFDRILEAEGVWVKPVQVRAPNQNAFAERRVQTVKQECLCRFIVFGESHLRYLLSEFLAHYHGERPHPSKGNLPLAGGGPPEADTSLPGEVVCSARLGGLLKHYQHRAA